MLEWIAVGILHCVLALLIYARHRANAEAKIARARYMRILLPDYIDDLGAMLEVEANFNATANRRAEAFVTNVTS